MHTIGLNVENSLSHLLDQISPEIENETTVIEQFRIRIRIRNFIQHNMCYNNQY